VRFAVDFARAAEAVMKVAQEGDVILTLGAGNVSQLAPQILDGLEGLKLGSLSATLR
jgi:UDP-N-acetylmuramate--alanine ligase